MGFKIGIELNDDITADLEGGNVILQAGEDEVSGHGYKWRVEDDVDGHGLRPTGVDDDVEGHGYKWMRLDVDDTEGHGYKWQQLMGEAVTVKLPSGNEEIQGRVRQVELDDDVSGHGYKW